MSLIKKLILIFTIVLLMTACNSADARLRGYFDIPKSVSLNEVTIRDAILRKIPLGTPEPVIRQKLSAFGIGKDKLSGYHASDKDRKAVIRIEYDPNSMNIVSRHYGVHLSYDGAMRLQDVVVNIWLTGP